MITRIAQATVVSLLLALPLHAQTYNWNGGSGSWSATNNWAFSFGGTNLPASTPPSNPGATANIATTNSTVAVDANYTVGTLDVGATDKVQVNDGKTLTVTSAINNAGAINVNSSGDPTALVIGGNVSISGGGTVTFNGGVLGSTGTASLTNVDNTIQGGASSLLAQLSGPLTSITNNSNGTFNANLTGGYLAMSAATIQNAGTLEASNGGTLMLGGIYGSTSLTSTGGAITAQAGSPALS